MNLPGMQLDRRALAWALGGSLLIHGLVLFIPRDDVSGSPPALARMEARLGPLNRPVEAEPPAPPVLDKKKPPGKNAKPAARPRFMTAEKSRGPAVAVSPKWSAAEKAEMNRFLDELAGEAKARPKPTLAQRSVSMAREYGRQMAQQDEAGVATLELRPNGPPVDPFSLELYLDGLVKRLNRSAGFVQNDPRSKGVRSAAIQFRLNPDGGLKSFVVLHAGDQADEIAYIKSVVERAVPFLPFPPDIDKAAKSLGVTVCIKPGSGGGLGFSRIPGKTC
ncbi:MAG: hypothetical protein Q8S26_19060 [Azonexus sp.]|nr:hypothetical protein [Azonexus sp.]